MKLRTNLRAGANCAYKNEDQCKVDREFWKTQAYNMELYANGRGSLKDVYVSPNPPQGFTGFWAGKYITNAPMTIECKPSSTTPPTTLPGGGYVGNIYYPDMSGVCTTTGQIPTPTPIPPTTGQPPSGGYVGGVFYPDVSGICAA